MQFISNKRFSLLKKIIVSILIITIIFFFSIILITNNQLNKINRTPANNLSIDPEEEIFEPDTPPLNEENEIIVETAPDEIEWDKDIELITNKNIKNILLIGQDKRPNESRARSDSMILISIDQSSKKIKLTSILRDLYVQIPGYSDNRINASYAWGGMKLLDSTIEKNFGIKIDHNIEVDFNSFKKIIDKFDGIDIYITEKEANYFNKNGYDVNPGYTHMNGEQALFYARIRYIDSDFKRTSRQRNIIQAIYNKIKQKSINQWFELSNSIFPLITTDMTNSEIISTIYTIYSMNVKTFESYQIPCKGSFSNKYIRKMSVLVPNLSINRKYIMEKIYEK